ncbi:heme-binding protein [Paraburkholderia jirisanensis]
MQTKNVLSSSEIAAAMAAARTQAAHMKLAVSIAVVDDGGHPLALERTDDAAPITAYIAMDKARTAALGRRESKVFEDMINGGRVAWLSVPLLNGILEGGVPVLVNGRVVGGIGVSGASPSDDAIIAKCGADCVSG